MGLGGFFNSLAISLQTLLLGLRRRAKIVISNDEDSQEDHSKQGRKIAQIDEDEGVTLVYTAEPKISTANVLVSTAGAEVSTTAESLVYIRRSVTKRKDKEKAIMKEAEPVQKKTKLQLEQERLGLEEALRMQEQLDAEERQRIARFKKKRALLILKNGITFRLKLKLMKS
ncbi:hypothetical protein Tco_1055333 [Tanacetum coccineum]|uniref:Uncharacterized protein n=1 Tax=Tanacetum coccineum TaxID=301880 RepID=A0ABQ5GZE3_9ASTR